MQQQSGTSAVQAYAASVVRGMRARSAAEIAERRALLEAAVDELKATGMTPERMLLEIKHISEPGGENTHSSAGWTEVVTWCLERYFATEPRRDSSK